MTTIIEGMTPAQFIAAVNANIAEMTFTGSTFEIDAVMPTWNVITNLTLGGCNGLSVGVSGQTFINSINALTNADLTIAADVKTFGAVGNGSDDDSAAINTAVAAGNIIIQNGTFLLSASIKIPSNRTVYLKNCIVKMADASYDNFFINANPDTGNTNIKILGLGGVTLDGNAPNNDDDYATYGPINTSPACPPYSGTIHRYIGILFAQVTNFEIAGLYLYDYMHWGIYLQHCINGSLHDMNWNHNTLTVNQDGIGIAHCSFITVYNIVGHVGDDFIGVGSAKPSGLAYTGYEGWDEGDCHDITMYNFDLVDARKGALLASLAGDGGKTYNLIVRNARVRLAGAIFYSYYPTYAGVPPAKTDFYNINIDNVYLDAILPDRIYPFAFGQSIMNFTATNITNMSGNDMYNLYDGDQSDNVTINGVQVE